MKKLNIVLFIILIILIGCKGEEKNDEKEEIGKSIKKIDFLLVYSSEEGGDRDLYTIKADGTNKKNLLDLDSKEGHPVWSPDGSKLFFTRITSYGDWRLKYINTNEIKTSSIPEEHLFSEDSIGYINFHPYKNIISYHCRENGNVEIFTLNLDTKEKELISSSNAYNLWIPTFSPDGKYLVYDKERNFGSGELVVKNLMKKEDAEIQITNNSTSDWGPDFQPYPIIQSFIFDSNSDGDRDIYMKMIK